MCTCALRRITTGGSSSISFPKLTILIDSDLFLYEQLPVKGVFYPAKARDGKSYACDAFVITAHDQRVYLADGDWILPEPDGEHFYPCKDDIFRATYEEVEGEPA